MIALPIAWWMWCSVCTMMVRDAWCAHQEGALLHHDGA